MGWLLRTVERYLTHDFNSSSQLAAKSGFAFAVYAVFAGQMFLLWRGSLMASISNLLPIFTLMLLCTKKSKNPEPEIANQPAYPSKTPGLARG